ncbi:MAG TPA: cation:proton antiporter [Ktedonobacterales bacterium]|nr:cation:proton antiporter [Ktedonobacterales bacterium]
MDLWFTLLAVVLTVSALVAGLVIRGPLSFPMLFLSLGLILGPGALGVVNLEPRSPALGAVATVSLALVLFLDAAKLDADELRRHWSVPVLSLGPVTLLTVGGIAVAAHFLFGAGLVPSLLLGAVLATTDPVVMRDVLRNEQIPRSVRQALGVEAGMNDVVVLPLVLVLSAVLEATSRSVLDWAVFLAELLLLSPLMGLVIGGIGAWLMGKIDERQSVPREYQSLYGLGLVLASYVGAQAVGGDGFLAAFFAGVAVNVFDVTLCDCFMDYGEVTAEMAMLLAFILFGIVLSSLLPLAPLVPSLALAALVILVIRPLTVWLVLRRARISLFAQGFIGWFGPRGLSALLLALLVVMADLPLGDHLLAITGVVVLVSVVAHGVTATPLSAWYGRRVARARQTEPEERVGTVGGLFEGEATEIPRIAPEELARQLAGPEPPIVLDVRARAAYEDSNGQIPGSVRVLPDHVTDWAARHQPGRAVVAYCT